LANDDIKQRSVTTFVNKASPCCHLAVWTCTNVYTRTARAMFTTTLVVVVWGLWCCWQWDLW